MAGIRLFLLAADRSGIIASLSRVYLPRSSMAAEMLAVQAELLGCVRKGLLDGMTI